VVLTVIRFRDEDETWKQNDLQRNDEKSHVVPRSHILQLAKMIFRRAVIEPCFLVYKWFPPVLKEDSTKVTTTTVFDRSFDLPTPVTYDMTMHFLTSNRDMLESADRRNDWLKYSHKRGLGKSGLKIVFFSQGLKTVFEKKRKSID
jgi:hypothetical protein